LRRLSTKYWTGQLGLTKMQIYLLSVFVITGILYRYIANDNYLICMENGISLTVSSEKCSSGLRTPVPYSAQTIDKKNRSVGPFDKQDVSSLYYRHWLGTDLLGRDTLAGLIWGTNVALKVGFFASLISLLIGIAMGYLSGYIGDDTIKVYRWQILVTLLLLLAALFYAVYGNGLIRWLPTFFFLAWGISLVVRNDADYMGKHKVSIPFDVIVSRVIEVFRSVPDIFIILVLVSLFRKAALTNVIIIIAIMKWPAITRFLRAEILKLKRSDHVVASKALGISRTYIFRKNILPLALSPVIVSVAFGFSSSILLESTLSFLGIGIPIDQVTWGSILSGARSNISSWWLALFPGIYIYLTVRLFHSIGDSINDKLVGNK